LAYLPLFQAFRPVLTAVKLEQSPKCGMLNPTHSRSCLKPLICRPSCVPTTCTSLLLLLDNIYSCCFLLLASNYQFFICVQELYGWSMDAIVKEIGLKNNCTL